MKILVSKNKQVASEHLADEIIYAVKNKPSLVLGVATGKTMVPVYKNLVRLSKKFRVDFSKVKFFMIDEYLDSKDKGSRFNFYLNNALFKPLKIKENQINRLEPNTKDKNYCSAYENKLKKLGYLDLLLLGIGMNGHIAFNEPGSSISSKTRMINLSTSTLKSNFKTSSNLPSKAVTIGISTILKSKRIILAAFGKEKSKIMQKTIECLSCKEIPATFLKLHGNTLIVLDKQAASRLK